MEFQATTVLAARGAIRERRRVLDLARHSRLRLVAERLDPWRLEAHAPVLAALGIRGGQWFTVLSEDLGFKISYKLSDSLFSELQRRVLGLA